MKPLAVGLAVTGSFCTHERLLLQIDGWRQQGMEITPILSYNVAEIDTRFGTAASFRERLTEATGHQPLLTLTDVEPIGPRKMFDVLVVAPCTGSTLGRLACSISDTPVTLAVKSHLRRSLPVVLAVSTNDGLAGAAENIGRLLARKHYYFVPFSQDDAAKKPTSLVADFSLIHQTLEAALTGHQLQPVLR